MNFVLRIDQWRCGKDGPYSLGIGETQLRNDQGFLCCVGQWTEQVEGKELEPNEAGEPACLERDIEYLTIMIEDYAIDFGYLSRITNTNLASDCMSINDTETTTVAEKIKLLHNRLAQDGHTLEVIGEIPIQ